MSKMIQVRNVPDDIHRTLKVRAAERGVSLSDYVLELARRDASRPTLEELARRVAKRPPPRDGATGAEIIRELRGPLHDGR